jgi:soluble lytic murein transglycosylase-like protein
MVGALAVVAMATVRTSAPVSASEGSMPGLSSATERREVALLHADIESARAELRLAAARLERWNKIFGYSRRYGIAADLSSAIYDAAINEKIDPELAFPLVRLESRFNERAESPVGASGLTQLMLPTAREFDPTVTSESIFDRETNLRIGFRYLHKLIRWQKGDVEMALLAYNRGPAAVEVAKDLALDASNGYDSIVLRGYKGKGILD